MDAAIASLIADVRAAIYYLILLVSGLGGGWYALSGLISWWEHQAGYGDVMPRQYMSEILIASILFSITSLFAATGGETFSATANLSGYAVLSADLGDASGAANNVVNSVFALCAALGWLAQTSAIVIARNVGRGKSETSVWRILGLLMGGSVLADMSTFVTSVDSTMKLGIFTGGA